MSQIKGLRNLAILFSVMIFFLGCKSTEIVWHDLRSDTTAPFNIEIGFADGDWNCIDIKLKRKSKACRFIPEGYECVSWSNNSNIVFTFYLPENDHHKIEIFVADTHSCENLYYDTVLDKIDDEILLYVIQFYDSEINRYCILSSKDNFFNIDKEDRNLDTNLMLEDYFKLLDEKDVAEYSPLLSDEEKKMPINSCSCFIKSKISDFFLEIPLNDSGEVNMAYYYKNAVVNYAR